MKSPLLCLGLVISVLAAFPPQRLSRDPRLLANTAVATTKSSTTATASRASSSDADLTCNQELMISYGLQGNSKPITRQHQYCPGLTQNCCTPDDEKSTMYYWTTDSKGKIERYYELYLYALKYILGFSSEGFLLARDYAQSPKAECKQAAADYQTMNLNPKLTLEMYNSAR